MATPSDVENLRAVFKKILQAHQLNPEDIKEDRKKVYMYDTGFFECTQDQCSYSHSWHSKFSWVTFNLKELEISYRWRMKCQYCLSVCQPTFSVDQIKAMFEKAVRKYKGEPLNNNNGHYYPRRERSQPHMPQLCEKCLWGQSICWHFRRD